MNGIPTFQYKIFQLFLLINVVDTIFKVIYFTSMKNISIVITRSLVKKGPSNMHPFKKQQVLSLKKKKKSSKYFCIFIQFNNLFQKFYMQLVNPFNPLNEHFQPLKTIPFSFFNNLKTPYPSNWTPHFTKHGPMSPFSSFNVYVDSCAGCWVMRGAQGPHISRQEQP